MAEAISPTFDPESVNVDVVGGTGLVGGMILDILDERDFPVGDLRVLASEKSAGLITEWRGNELQVKDASKVDYNGRDIVIFSAGSETSKQLAPRVAADGAIVIDNSSAWRRDESVPLVVSEVNPEALENILLGIVANPNCSTMGIMPVLKPLHDEAGLESLTITTLQAVSGAGQGGIDELAEQEADQSLPSEVFPEPIAGNVIPQRGNLVGRDTDEEQKLLFESRKILGIADLAVSATCVSVPVVTGHSLSIEAQFNDNITPEQAESILAEAPGVQLADIPTPLKVAGGNTSLVGRIRQSGVIGKNGLLLFVTADNVRKGAALNTVQVAELLLNR